MKIDLWHGFDMIARMNHLMTAVLLTLAYSHQFYYPLTLEEIKTRLIKPWGRSTSNIGQVKLAVTALIKLKLVAHDQTFYFLSPQKSLVKLRQKRSLISRHKLSQAQRTAEILRHLPWVMAIFVTGSLSVMNSESANDIDFMIVTSAHRLWLTRPLVILVSLIMGKKRPLNQEKSNSWCFNLWLTENRLSLQNSRRNIFTAHEVLQALCLFDRSNIENKFLHQNSWVRDFLPNFFDQRLLTLSKTKPDKSLLYFNLNLILDALNLVSYGLQKAYMSLHRTQEEVGLEKAFFHPRDTRHLVGQGWERALNNMPLKSKS